MAAIFGEIKFFWKNVLVNLQRYPVYHKFRRNRSIAHSFRDINIFVFCNKFENSKWPPYLARQNFLENWDGDSAEIPCGPKISIFEI